MHASHPERERPPAPPRPSLTRLRAERDRAQRTQERLVAAWLRSLTQRRPQ